MACPSCVHNPACVLNTCSVFFNFHLFFLVALGLRCRLCSRGERGLLSAAAPGFLILVASLVAEHGF